MSRIGKHPVVLPKGVTAKVEGNTVQVKGPKGELERTLQVLCRRRKNNPILLSSVPSNLWQKALWILWKNWESLALGRSNPSPDWNPAKPSLATCFRSIIFPAIRGTRFFVPSTAFTNISNNWVLTW